MDHSRLVSEARARITWGDPPAEVRLFLISNGVPTEQAQAEIRNLIQDRNREIRKSGLRSLVFGCILLLPGSLGLWLLLGPNRGHWLGTGGAKAVGVALGLGAWGVWKLMNGIMALLRPQEEHGEITDISL